MDILSSIDGAIWILWHLFILHKTNYIQTFAGLKLQDVG